MTAPAVHHVRRSRARPPRRFLAAWTVPEVGVVKAFADAGRIGWRLPPLGPVGRAVWECYREELAATARAWLARGDR